MIRTTLLAAVAGFVLAACATGPDPAKPAAAPAAPKPLAMAAAPAAPKAPAAPAVAQPAAPPAAPSPAGPAPLAIPSPTYISIPMEMAVNKPAKDVWARIGKYCDISEWLQIAAGCKMISGKEGEVGSVRTVGNEVLVGKTELSYTYTQPTREGRPYNLYHGTLEVRPVTATTSKIVYTLMYDNSLIPGDDAAKKTEIEGRRTRFMQGIANMKTLAEGGKLAAAPAPTAPATPPPAPAPLAIPAPNYVSIPMETLVNKPAKDVWARIGKYCDISEWLPVPAGCKMISGKEGDVGSVRTVGNEVLVGKTELSYAYTQPTREGRPYNLYHGLLEVRPVTATTSRIVYTLMYDNSFVPGDAAAKAAEIERRRVTFTRAVNNMKILAEGGTLPPPAAPAAPAAPAPKPQ